MHTYEIKYITDRIKHIFIVNYDEIIDGYFHGYILNPISHFPQIDNIKPEDNDNAQVFTIKMMEFKDNNCIVGYAGFNERKKVLVICQIDNMNMHFDESILDELERGQ